MTCAPSGTRAIQGTNGYVLNQNVFNGILRTCDEYVLSWMDSQYVLLINAPAIFPMIWNVTRSFVNQVGRRISTEIKEIVIYTYVAIPAGQKWYAAF